MSNNMPLMNSSPFTQLFRQLKQKREHHPAALLLVTFDSTKFITLFHTVKPLNGHDNAILSLYNLNQPASHFTLF